MIQNIWFNGTKIIAHDMSVISNGLTDIGEFFVEVVKHMPGLSSVELIGQEPGKVVIKTNEGLMTRSSIEIEQSAERIRVEFDEKYKAGRLVTVTSHNLHLLEVSPEKVNIRITISDVKAPGPLGFLYRKFGSGNLGSAILNSYSSYAEHG